MTSPNTLSTDTLRGDDPIVGSDIEPDFSEDMNRATIGAAISIIEGSPEVKINSLRNDALISAYETLYGMYTSNAFDGTYIGDRIQRLVKEKGMTREEAIKAEANLSRDAIENTVTNGSGYAEDVIDKALAAVSVAEGENKLLSIATLWTITEKLATFESSFPAEFTNYRLMEILDHIREAAPLEDTQSEHFPAEAFAFYHAAELAYGNDFKTARLTLAEMDATPSLQRILTQRLEEAETYIHSGPHISDERSAENLKSLIDDSDEPYLSLEQLEVADVGITIGAQLGTLEAILDQQYGRYLSVHEHATSGGSDLSASKQRNKTYRMLRREAEEALGHNSNIFLPRPIYGALTSDLQSDRASGYGEVTFYLSAQVMDNQDTTYLYGDSLDRSGRPSQTIPSRQLNKHDAELAYMHILEQKRVDASMYIEAHVPGLHLNDVKKVSIACLIGTVDKVAELAERVLERNIETEVVFDWRFQPYIDRLVKDGLSEEDAYKGLVTELRTRFGNNPNLSLVFNFRTDSTEWNKEPNSEELEKAGIVVRQVSSGGVFGSGYHYSHTLD